MWPASFTCSTWERLAGRSASWDTPARIGLMTAVAVDMAVDMAIDRVNQDADSLPVRQPAEEDVQAEMAALVQFAFFRPHLAELLEATARAEIGLIVLKGAALAETVYARPSLRRFGDLDVLVRRADAARARTLLEGLGYIADRLQWAEIEGGRDCQANFFKHTGRGSVVVELHTELINNDLFFGQVRVDEGGLWGRARAARLAGTAALVLGPEDQILHLCLHLAGHYLAAPQSLRDIAQVIPAGAVDWDLLVRLARAAGAGPACFAGLLAASRLGGAPVPDAVPDALAPRSGRVRLEQLALARAADSFEDPTCARTERLRPALLWHLLGGPAARVRAARGIVFPSRQWLLAHYAPERVGPLRPPPMLWLQAVHWAALLRRVTGR